MIMIVFYLAVIDQHERKDCQRYCAECHLKLSNPNNFCLYMEPDSAALLLSVPILTEKCNSYVSTETLFDCSSSSIVSGSETPC